jgi:N-acetylneuraminic acid mutarotase
MKRKLKHDSPIRRSRYRVIETACAAGIALSLPALVFVASAARAQETASIVRDSAPAFTSFEVTGAGTGALEGTVAIGINAGGDVAGMYIDSNGVRHGFVRQASGAVTPFKAPAAGAGQSQGTIPLSINASGVVTGFYIDAQNTVHGFVRSATGAITSFDVPGAGSARNRGTTPISINAAGTIVGDFTDDSAVFHGFIRAANGSFTTFEAPGAGSNGHSDEGTVPFAINAAGTVTGYYKGATGGAHGFVRAVSGAITSFDGPQVLGNGGYLGTNPTSIDAAGEIAGTYVDASLKRHAFVRSAGGTLVPFDAPGVDATPCGSKGPSAIFCGTGAVGINTSGSITGGYVDADGVMRGFLRLANGTMNSFDAPDAGTSAGGVEGTAGVGINDTGIIVGTYADPNNVFHGYVYSPALVATTVSLKASTAASVYGQSVTLTAKVTSADGAPPNGEDVTFLSGKVVLGKKALSAGSASLTITTLPAGTDSITAVYSGDVNFAGSTSNAVSHTVTKAKSTTKLTSSKNPSTVGVSVTFAATVTGRYGGTAKGTVTFSDGKTVLKAVALSGGVAKLATAALPAGTDSITAVYGGSASFDASTSNTVKEVVAAAEAGVDEWTWMGGSNTLSCQYPPCGQPGVYGILGTFAAENVPGSRVYATSWTDKNHNFWLFGGAGFIPNNAGELNDLWEFNPTANEWAWRSGSSTEVDSKGVYGKLGTPAPANVPGSRTYAASWMDSSGNLWLFGGNTLQTYSQDTIFNDLWRFSPVTSEWTWIGGNSTQACNPVGCGEPGVYGKLGTPAATNIPGSRSGAASWIDNKDDFWLYGGEGIDGGDNEGTLSDLWEFSPSTNKWAWMGGSSIRDQSPVYGTLGKPAASNSPGSRESPATWTDGSGNFWLFGGSALNDLWEFNPSTRLWTWMGGSSTLPGGEIGLPGVYGTLGLPAADNVPGSSEGPASWADNSHHFWLFGGYGFDAADNLGYLNDLWEFDPSTKEWTWMGGSKTVSCTHEFQGHCGQPGVYGRLGIPAAGDVPSGRWNSSNWSDANGNLWLFGGWGFSDGGNCCSLNDLWRYQPPATLPAAAPVERDSKQTPGQAP